MKVKVILSTALVLVGVACMFVKWETTFELVTVVTACMLVALVVWIDSPTFKEDNGYELSTSTSELTVNYALYMRDTGGLITYMEFYYYESRVVVVVTTARDNHDGTIWCEEVKRDVYKPQELLQVKNSLIDGYVRAGWKDFKLFETLQNYSKPIVPVEVIEGIKY